MNKLLFNSLTIILASFIAVIPMILVFPFSSLTLSLTIIFLIVGMTNLFWAEKSDTIILLIKDCFKYTFLFFIFSFYMRNMCPYMDTICIDNNALKMFGYEFKMIRDKTGDITYKYINLIDNDKN